MGFSALRRASELQAPASLRLHAQGPRYLTFITASKIAERDAIVTLAPLAMAAAAPRAYLDFSLDGQALWVAGSLAEIGDGFGRFVVRRDPMPRPSRSARLPIPGGSLVATFVPEGTGLGRCFSPVIDLGPHTVRIESTVPFDPGMRLRNLVLTHRNQVLRRGDGAVLDCGELRHPDGRVGFECGVRLRGVAAPEEATDDPADTFEIRDYGRVCAILWALCDLEYEVTLRAGNDRLPGRLTASRSPRSGIPDLRCILREPLPANAGTVQVECALFGSGYRFFARVLRRDLHGVQLLPAPIIRETHRREEERFVFPASSGATVRFRHPLEAASRVYQLSDLSSSGFSLYLRSDPDRSILWAGLPVREVELELPALTLKPPQARVRITDSERCGVEMGGLDERQAEQLRIELLRSSGHPVELHDGEDLDGVLDFHRRVQLLEPDMERNLLATLDEVRRSWRVAHQHPDGLMRTVLGRWRGQVGSSANVVRAYDSSWVLQHTAVASPSVPASPGLMYTILLGLITARSDGEYLASFASDDFKSLHSNWVTFAHQFSTPHFRGSTPFVLYAADAVPAARARPELRLLTGADEMIVENAARRLLDPVCAMSLNLRAGEIGIARTREAFASVGLERGREAWGSFRGDRCAAVLVREWASPGLSLSSLLSAGMLFPCGDEEDADAVRAACELLRELPAPGNPPAQFLFVPKSVNQAPVEQAGFRRVGGCVLYGLHRVGLREFLRFFAARYGFLQARMSVRKPVAA
jgi:hypothetical protein